MEPVSEAEIGGILHIHYTYTEPRASCYLAHIAGGKKQKQKRIWKPRANPELRVSFLCIESIIFAYFYSKAHLFVVLREQF